MKDTVSRRPLCVRVYPCATCRPIMSGRYGMPIYIRTGVGLPAAYLIRGNAKAYTRDKRKSGTAPFVLSHITQWNGLNSGAYRIAFVSL